VVSEHFRAEEGERGKKPGQLSPEFVEAVWSDAGSYDLKIGLRLADFYFNTRDDKAGISVLTRMIENSNPSGPAVIAAVKKLLARDQIKLATELIDKHRASMIADPDFQAVWARVIIAKKDSAQV